MIAPNVIVSAPVAAFAQVSQSQLYVFGIER
jgi:hypothetical protein